MKVLNLRCARDHRFEGWFASEDVFCSQVERGTIACPMCDDKTVTRLPSAPRLNVVSRRLEARSAASSAEAAATSAQAKWFRAMREVIDASEDVGDRFAEEARRIHHGEAEERAILGRASAEDAEALRDEGIEIVALALPAVLKGPVH